jgi:hypothetical protein
MLELQDVERMLEAAEKAAAADDLETADELLRSVARIQEAELGPFHPDLANTLNNLAIVAEKTGRLDEAEQFYRRAVAIAAASLPVDHPGLAASRDNLEAFCRARGVPIEPAGSTPFPVPGAAPETREPAPIEAPKPEPSAPTCSEPPPAPRRAVAMPAWAMTGVVFLIATLLIWRPWRSTETAAPAPAAVTAPRPAEQIPPPITQPPAAPAPAEPVQPPAIAPRNDRATPAKPQPAPARSPGVITLVTAELCRSFSPTGANWRCDPAGDSVSPGPIVLYTIVRSARDAVVVHRWYKGDALRQSVKLPIRANAAQGYRTYSRRIVDEGLDWRVEVRSANGDLLYTHAFAVR